MKLTVRNFANEEVGDIELSDEVFGLPVRRDILARVVNWQLAKRRAGSHKTKGISEISGTTKKPYKQKGTGRDHNAYGFTSWLAGGGIKGGVSVGSTDELGSAAVQDRFHVKNLHATILQQMGLDPNKLTYFYGGLDQKLVGVEGAEPIRQII